MTAQEIIKANGSDLNAYTDEQREIVKAYGWETYGYGFADTIRAETAEFDRDAYLDAMYL